MWKFFAKPEVISIERWSLVQRSGRYKQDHSLHVLQLMISLLGYSLVRKSEVGTMIFGCSPPSHLWLRSDSRLSVIIRAAWGSGYTSNYVRIQLSTVKLFAWFPSTFTLFMNSEINGVPSYTKICKLPVSLYTVDSNVLLFPIRLHQSLRFLCNSHILKINTALNINILFLA